MAANGVLCKIDRSPAVGAVCGLEFVAEVLNLFRRERLDEILFGVTWALARAPESFLNVPETDLYLAKTDAGPPRSGIPGLYIWFKFDDEEVRLLSIEVALESL